MIELHSTRVPASADALQAAWQALGSDPVAGPPGAHLGIEAGVPGLHPLQSTLLPRADWSLRLYGDGITVECYSEWGHALFQRPALQQWQARCARGQGWPVASALRAFNALFASAAHPLLIGALRFDAHQLAPGSEGLSLQAGHSADASLGLLMGGCCWFERDERGEWWQWQLALAAAEETAEVAVATMSWQQGKAVTSAAAGAAASKGEEPCDDGPPGAHADRVRRSLPRLASGELVSLTLSQSYRRRVALSARVAYDRLRSVNPAPACFYINDGAGECVFGASPDLQLLVRGRHVTSYPVCGTVAREAGPVGAAASLRELINEEVDAAALAVCTDALRSDLAPWCEPGSLQLLARREPMFLSTVVHTVDVLQGTVRAGAATWDLVLATTAPAMVTGTPRAAALRAIAEFEAGPRGWYGGMVLQMRANGDACVGTLLRAATVRDGVAEVRTGGDLLADSDPQREEAESRLKTRSLWRAFGLEPTPAAAQPAAQGGAQPGAAVRVALIHPEAAFAPGLRDCLKALGMADTAAADPTAQAAQPAQVNIETAWGLPAQTHMPCLALGDAALQRLAHSGCDVQAQAAGHGRVVRLQLTERGAHCLGQPAWPASGLWVCSHASRRWVGGQPGSWQVWATGSDGMPLMLAREASHPAGSQAPQAPQVLMLFRPDSLMSDPQAVALLRAALVWLVEPTR